MSIYSIDSLVYDIYTDILHQEFDEKEQTAQVIDDILKLYEPPEDFILSNKRRSMSSKWFPKKIPRIRAFCDYISKRDSFLSFRRGQEFYVLDTDKVEKTYFVSTDKRAPFSVGTMSGYVPSYYFNKF